MAAENPVPETLATVAAQISELSKQFDAVNRRFDAVDRRFDATDQRIAREAEDTRRHFDVVAEQTRAEFKMVIDKTNATNEKVDRLITRNAVEHAAFVEAIADHEVRQNVLERIRETNIDKR